jgi:hypothetical protein
MIRWFARSRSATHRANCSWSCATSVPAELRADDLAREVAALAITLHTSLIKSAVRDVLDR